MEKLFANITYYKGYRVSSTKEILNQAFIIPRVRRDWETMGKEPKFVARMGLRRSQRHGGTMANAMQSDLPNMVWDVVQENHWDGAFGVDESCRMLRSQSEAL